MDKMRVLIVDDSCAIQTIIRRSLEKIAEVDLETRMASDGDEAFDIARSWEPNLIVTDWHMPNMNGLELLNAVNQEMLGIKVGFVTAETSTKRLAKATEAGAKFIVNKPFACDALNATVLPVLQEDTVVTVCTDTKDNNQYKLQQASESPSPFDLDIEPKQLSRISTCNEIAATLIRQCNVSVSIQSIPTIALETIGTPFMLAFFSAANSSRVNGICVMDMACVLSLGGAISNIDKKETLEALKQKKLPAKHVVGGEIILTALADCMTDDEINPQNLILNKTNVITKASPKLKGLLETAATDRLDVKVSTSGYGHGRMILVAS